MAFNSLFIGKRVSLDGGMITLHDVSSVFSRDTPALVLFCRLASPPLNAVSYSLEITRIDNYGVSRVLQVRKRSVSFGDRLFSGQIMHVFAPDQPLERGYYSATITLNSGERTSTEFILV